ncbi:hypothetical protein [Enhygromyxa salina]|uniref:hypothetical protein n=1 Tax=Enhygromyxa salina TaxID=215803 RepID=UPI000D02F838|nr:hypothetical protein [Enhygromyxa salina]
MGRSASADIQQRIEGPNVVLPEPSALGSDFNEYYVEDGANCSIGWASLGSRVVAIPTAARVGPAAGS